MIKSSRAGVKTWAHYLSRSPNTISRYYIQTNLDPNIVRDSAAHKVEVGLARGRVRDLDLLEAALKQELEERRLCSIVIGFAIARLQSRRSVDSQTGGLVPNVAEGHCRFSSFSGTYGLYL